MPTSSGGRIGPYDVIAKLGGGGMGEVYRAHDPRLNHPNVAHVHGLATSLAAEGQATVGPVP